MSVNVQKNAMLALMLVLLIAVFTHSWNLFHYPYYEGDEGIYVSQAWSVLTKGELSPYHYWYDHPPLGWITMAMWPALFGGNFFAFGESSIDNMRVFMVIVHVLSAALVYFIARRLSGKRLVALAAVIIFTLSPLFVYYQRRVLLDNLMTLWILASFALLIVRDRNLFHVALSGVLLGIATLTKIPALVFTPFFMAILYAPHFFGFIRGDLSERVVTLKQRLQPVVVWAFSLVCVLSLFIGYTIVNGEFLPAELSGSGKASFLDGIQFQLERESPQPLLHPGSSFRVALADWLRKDSFTVAMGTLSTILGLIFAYKLYLIRSVVLAVVIYAAFMMRGGIVTNFHILPLIPFISILISIVLHNTLDYILAFLEDRRILSERSNTKKTRNVFFVMIMIVVSWTTLMTSERGYLTRDETSNHNAAIRHIKENFDENTSIMMDVQGLVDLWDTRNINEKKFEKADWYSKLIFDDYIQNYKYEGQWQKIDYVLVSHELLRQMKDRPAGTLAKDAYVNSTPTNSWLIGADHVDIPGYQSSYGNWAVLQKVNAFAQEASGAVNQKQ